MPFLDSLDVANRAIQHVGGTPILDVAEDSQNNLEVSNAYDKVRRAELRRNVWRFAVRKAALRAISTTALLLVPSDYDATKTYLQGEVVKDSNGSLWVSEVADNFNNAPGGNNEAWDMYFGPMTADVWDSGTTYFSGELVYIVTGTAPNAFQIYMSLTNGNSGTPGTGSAWDATIQYNQDQVVSYSGTNYRSLLPVNINNTPANGPAAWSSLTAYIAADTVSASDGFIYSAVGNTTGNDPISDNGVHWTNTGAMNAWSSTPTLLPADINWRPIRASLKNLGLMYPLGSGPSSQTTTRNVYRVPAGYLRKAPQNEKVPVSALGGPSGVFLDDWEFDGDYIVTQQVDPIIFRFVADVTKVRAMDDMFCEGLAARIATAVASRLTQSDAKLATIASAYKLFMGEARLVNAIEESYEDAPEDEFIAVRY